MNYRVRAQLYCCRALIYVLRVYVNSLRYFLIYSFTVQSHWNKISGKFRAVVVKLCPVLYKLQGMQ